MKPHRLAIAVIPFALAACTAPQAPAEPAQQPQTSVPASVAAPATQDAPMAKRAPGDEMPPMQVFRAFGTEPFWNVNVEGNTLTYTTPEDQAGVVMQGERRLVEDGVEINGSDDGKSFGLTVKVGTCSDGMSDNVYELTAEFRYGTNDYKGCAEAAK